MMAEALITQGIALARFKRTERAQFQQAIQIALRVNALNIAGLAALTMIEEIDTLSSEDLTSSIPTTREWLSTSQSQEVTLRLGDAAGKVIANVREEVKPDEATEILLTKPGDLQKQVLKYEGTLIKRALVQTDGSVTRAAPLLSLSYQGLCYILETRHKDLLPQRTPIRRRAPSKHK